MPSCQRGPDLLRLITARADAVYCAVRTAELTPIPTHRRCCSKPRLTPGRIWWTKNLDAPIIERLRSKAVDSSVHMLSRKPPTASYSASYLRFRRSWAKLAHWSRDDLSCTRAVREIGWQAGSGSECSQVKWCMAALSPNQSEHHVEDDGHKPWYW